MPVTVRRVRPAALSGCNEILLFPVSDDACSNRLLPQENNVSNVDKELNASRCQQCQSVAGDAFVAFQQVKVAQHVHATTDNDLSSDMWPVIDRSILYVVALFVWWRSVQD